MKKPMKPRPVPEGMGPMSGQWHLDERFRYQREVEDERMGFYGPHPQRLTEFVAQRSAGVEVEDWPAFTDECIKALRAIDAARDAADDTPTEETR